ncbi:MAG: hypothetical protein NZM04_04100 [Methylacidiphilales bacterium]|nr:hypothetical protein [Candidatus Methylacidiphilales bacterium]MDW8350219.1 hypothetical protein [Verrucomicrobiae bacterium]
MKTKFMKKKLAISATVVMIALMGFYRPILMANSGGPGDCVKDQEST